MRYGSTSTIPLARRIFATCAASTESAKSIVPTTLERAAGSVTNGVANSEASAHEYRCAADSAVRPVAQPSPPLVFIQSRCSADSSRGATAGVVGGGDVRGVA